MISLSKDRLVDLARACMEVVRDCGLVGSPIAFRAPVSSNPAAAQLPDQSPPETDWLEWETLREYLPELNDHIIISWLSSKGSLRGATGRVLYRGLQRVLDLGALSGLKGKPCGFNGGILWLKFR